MKPDQLTLSNKTNSSIAMDLFLKVGAYSANRTSDRTEAGKSRSNIFQAVRNNPKKYRYLKIAVIKKMLSKFLLEKKMKKEELAKVLNITAKELEKLLLHEKVEIKFINKVNLPLIKLFCKTKFNS